MAWRAARTASPAARRRIIEGLAEDWHRLDQRIDHLSDEITVVARQDVGCERGENAFRNSVQVSGCERQKRAMHGGAFGSGAPRGNQNALKHGPPLVLPLDDRMNPSAQRF